MKEYLHHPRLERVLWEEITECAGGRVQCKGVILKRTKIHLRQPWATQDAVVDGLTIAPINGRHNLAAWASITVPLDAIPAMIRALQFAVAGELGREVIEAEARMGMAAADPATTKE